MLPRSLLLMGAAVIAIIMGRPKDRWLLAYLVARLLSSSALLSVRLLGYGVESDRYSSVYTVTTTAVVVAALGYTIKALGRRIWIIPFEAVIVGVVIFTGTLPFPDHHLYITSTEGLLFGAIGLALWAAPSRPPSHILASMWLANSAWQYGYTGGWSDNPTLWLSLNSWVPTTITVMGLVPATLSLRSLRGQQTV